jgi:hypothetical protein
MSGLIGLTSLSESDMQPANFRRYHLLFTSFLVNPAVRPHAFSAKLSRKTRPAISVLIRGHS